MKVTYIYHSCYLLEFDRFSLLFDFYEDVRRDDGSLWVSDYLINKAEDLYVFSTHSHKDHFNPQIFEWNDKKTNIKYILSKEVANVHALSNNNIVLLDILETFKDNNIEVRAYGSTDTGGSFCVGIEGRKYFHAGDLNNWHWNEEVSKMDAAGFENSFLCELELLAENTNQVYLAMFPIDPRLGTDYMKGAQQFVSRVSVDYFLPMHFGDNYDKANAFESYARLQNCKYLGVNKRGQTFNL